MNKIRELNRLIKEAGKISHMIDHSLSHKHPNSYNETFKKYSLWKLDCGVIRLEYPEYYATFEESDGLSDIANSPFSGKKYLSKGVRTTHKDENGHIVVDEETIRQMKLVKIGLEKRKKALIMLLRDFKSKKLSTKTHSLEYYVIKVDENFYINDRIINLPNKKAFYFILFSILYDMAMTEKKGFEIFYKEFIPEIKKRIPKTKHYSTEEIMKFINNNLLNEKTGFFTRIKMPNDRGDSRKLIETGQPNKSINFNNRK